MARFRYPANAIIDGQALVEPTVLAPCRVTIDGITHGPEICELWTPEALAALGIKRVVEDALPVDEHGWPYLPGEPVDDERATEILRSFPNATPDTEGSAANLANLAAAVRAERGVRIAACDWTQLPDAPLTIEAKAAWADYRQQLRDITTQAGFPQVMEWPVGPGAS